MTADRDPLPYTFAEVRQKLQGNIWGVLGRLRLKDDSKDVRRRLGDVIYPLNPRRADRSAGSFVVWTAGDRAGAYVDFALQDCKGSVFDLIMYIERLQAPMDAYWWALDFLNLDRRGADGRPRSKADDQLARERAEADRQAAVAKQRQADEAVSRALFNVWLSCPKIEGTPAERYLRDVRAIPLERLEHMPGAIRWAEAVDYVDPETGEIKTWRNVMLSAMTRGSKVVALHRTYLKPDGSGKAEFGKAKLMKGPCSGAAIRLSSGPSGLSPTKAAAAFKRGPLAIGEGIETCLTVACARPDYRVWAAGSLSLMGLIDWPDCASAVVLLGENDQGLEAQAAFARVVKHWEGQAKGRPVHVVASQVGSDFNDWAKAG